MKQLLVNSMNLMSDCTGDVAEPLAERLRHAFEEALQIRIAVAIARVPLEHERLSKGEALRYSELRTYKRRREWMIGRAALKGVLAAFGEDIDSSRLRFPNSRYSLSHTGEFAIAVAAIEINLAGVGIDVELDREVNSRAARFFLRDHELEWLESVSPSNLAPALLRLWTVKEAIYKSDTNNEESLVGFYSLNAPAELCGVAHTARKDVSARRFQYVTVPIEAGFVSLSISRAESGVLKS